MKTWRHNEEGMLLDEHTFEADECYESEYWLIFSLHGKPKFQVHKGCVQSVRYHVHEATNGA